jgi:hypothetical protein
VTINFSQNEEDFIDAVIRGDVAIVENMLKASPSLMQVVDYVS